MVILMKKKVWGPIIWNLLHCITIKIKDEYFNSEKKELFNIIYKICTYLPCPICANSATFLLKKNKISSLKTKKELINFIYNLHNEVNKKTKKQYVSKNILDIYEKKNFRNTLNDYYFLSLNTKYNQNLMYIVHTKKSFLNKYSNYFKKNIHKFNN